MEKGRGGGGAKGREGRGGVGGGKKDSQGNLKGQGLNGER